MPRNMHIRELFVYPHEGVPTILNAEYSFTQFLKMLVEPKKVTFKAMTIPKAFEVLLFPTRCQLYQLLLPISGVRPVELCTMV